MNSTTKPHKRQATHRLPSLDGLRASAISLVLIFHVMSTAELGTLRGPLPFYYGEQGVSIFFVISGFIITHLLIRGSETTSYQSIPNFYLRRALRILPPLLAYLSVIELLVSLNILKLLPLEVLAALLFFRDYVYPTRGTGPWVGHLWSLSVEEQFYLLWPLAMAFLNRRTVLKIGVLIIAIEPLARVLTYFAVPSWRGLMGTMFHTRADSLAIGCVAALLFSNGIPARVGRLLSNPLALVLAIAMPFAVSPALFLALGGRYTLLFGFTVDGISIAFTILSTVLYPASWLGKLLNTAPALWLGRCSYSIYLWQELFLHPASRILGGNITWNLLAAIAAGSISYYLIETPANALSLRLSEKAVHVPVGDAELESAK